KRLLLFCFVLFTGAVLNLEYFYFDAAISQAIMLVEPLLLFVAIVNLPFTEEHIVSYSRLLRKLIFLEIAIGLLQLPGRIASGDSEAVHGTFPGNAEQYAAFLMIAVFYLIGRAVVCPEKKRLYVAAVILILVLDVSIDNKASWLGTTVALAAVLWQLDILKVRRIGIVGLLALMGSTAVLIGYIASGTSTTISKYEKLWEIIKSGNISHLGKVKSYIDIARSHFTNPHMLLVGAGPSNMYSRACRQFYLRVGELQKMYVNPDILTPEPDSGSEVHARLSDSMAGVIKRTLAKPYYMNYYGDRERIYAVGSGQVDGTFSPYAGLLGETGLLGTWLYLSVYLVAFRWLWHRVASWHAKPEVLPLLTSSCGMMIYVVVNSVYGQFLETTRYTTLLWSMIGLVYVCAQREKSLEPVGIEHAPVGLTASGRPVTGAQTL
ncbi:MAG: hypothetical protein ACP5MD_15575, partial [Verrucomicrobiia bacterium]